MKILAVLSVFLFIVVSQADTKDVQVHCVGPKYTSVYHLRMENDVKFNENGTMVVEGRQLIYDFKLKRFSLLAQEIRNCDIGSRIVFLK